MSSQSADISDEDSRTGSSAYEPTLAADKGRRSRSTRGKLSHVVFMMAETRDHYSLRPLPENEEQVRAAPERFRSARLSRLRGFRLESVALITSLTFPVAYLPMIPLITSVPL